MSAAQMQPVNFIETPFDGKSKIDSQGVGTYNMTFDFEQSVQGSGYFMTYRYIQLPSPGTNQKGPMYKDYAHGSGTIDNEMILNADVINYIKNVGCYQEWEAYSCIVAREDNSMVYSPMTMAIGNGYYARNPIRYDSLLKEKTYIKNYRPVTMMHHQVEYAKAVDKEIDVFVKDKQYYYGDPIYQGVGYTSMNITEDVTDGMVHIGVLQGEPNSMSKTGYDIPRTTAWRNPMIEIDENYIGTFTINKRMLLEVPYKLVVEEKDWLSCCIGGCDTMEWCGPYNPCEPCILNPPMKSASAPSESSYFVPEMRGNLS
ncbi:hypothetical protein [Candidatus Methanocrinis natronophilus]|uniref:Uncharacterized protein n=1 Tax=Candidatus Methanocrinis natronophilus TaxID=3033396 RepID=A0ABT5X9V8_9EURY|nr:hypothetical protein [Candidatus Methanocrinis natronophilus]MDF0591499.1 hypothetical protein [Candidatus Methanocrinis natronophilus]